MTPPLPAGLKDSLKDMLGAIPLTVELYASLRPDLKTSDTFFNLPRLEQALPALARTADEAAQARRTGDPARKHVALFGYLPYWLEYQVLIGLTLAGLGCETSLLYWPYRKYNRGESRFDLRRQAHYLNHLLEPASPVLRSHSLLSQPECPIPAALQTALEDTTLRDTQYILQHEEVDTGGEIYRMRWERNRGAAARALTWFDTYKPEVVIIPNGAILEFEAVYLAARHAGVKTVTYEFSELSQRIWLSQDADVMRQDTDALWAARRNLPLGPTELDALRQMFAARQRPLPGADFVFRYQGAGRAGGAELQARLGLDDRPVILLPANVVGDSVTLGRQIFSRNMTEWLERTLLHLADRPQVQLVVRVHPGEALTQGPSMAEIVYRTLPGGIPPHIHLIPADAKINTYDLVELAGLGLVYTTTVGLEMAMSAVDVIVSGQAHYRGRGFTHDPASWEGYFNLLDAYCTNPPSFTGDVSTRQARTELAWNYAYRYFFEFPHPFPWHLYHLDADLEEWPLERVLSPEGTDRFGRTFAYLAGEPLDWKDR